MPEKEVVRKAKPKLRTGQDATTAAGEFIREEMHHVREGEHGARSAAQAIASGLAKARRAGSPGGARGRPYAPAPRALITPRLRRAWIVRALRGTRSS